MLPKSVTAKSPCSYPTGPAVAHLLGYVGAARAEQYQETRDPLLIFPGFKVGKDGLEKTLDKQLIGKAGAARVEVNARGRPLRELATLEPFNGRKGTAHSDPFNEPGTNQNGRPSKAAAPYL